MRIQFHSQLDKLVNNRRRRPVVHLFSGLLSLASLAGLVYYFPPSANISLFNYELPLLPIVMISLGCSLFFLGTFAFKSKAHGFLITAFVLVYLLFRLNNLTHPFFFILLFALFLSLELFVSYRK